MTDRWRITTRAAGSLRLGLRFFVCNSLPGAAPAVPGVPGLPDVRRRVPRRRALALAGILTTLVATACGLALMQEGVERAREAAERSDGSLGRLGLAMQAYHARHGRLPPAALRAGDGRPLLSWRVLLLPHLGQDRLYREFKLDEPWDSPHNLRLLPRMPAVYAPPGRKASGLPPHHTVCHVFVGAGAAFEGREGLCVPADFPDGTANTILIVEAGRPVPWTRPQDLPFDREAPPPELTCLFRDGFRAVMVDGSVHFFRKGAGEEKLRDAIQRDNGPLRTNW